MLVAAGFGSSFGMLGSRLRTGSGVFVSSGFGGVFISCCSGIEFGSVVSVFDGSVTAGFATSAGGG